MRPAPDPSVDWMRHVCGSARVSVWVPWPLPEAWVLSLVAPVGDEVSGVDAVATVLSGPNPLGGPAEMMLVAEQPGVGLGTRVAGLPGLDPGGLVDASPYHHVQADQHVVPLWLVPTQADQAVAVGEHGMSWLWIAVRPASAGVLLVDHLALADARRIGEEVRMLPFGARSAWLDA